MNASNSDRDGLRILIVEDQPDCAESMAMLLRVWGHKIEIAPDGHEGLAKALSMLPDVVLLDLGLPGMSGYEVARHIRESRQHNRPLIIAVSGYGREADLRNSAKAGVDMHWLKPADPEALRRVLGKFQRVLADDTPIPADIGECC